MSGKLSNARRLPLWVATLLSLAPLGVTWAQSGVSTTASVSRTPDTFVDGPALPTLRVNEYQTQLLGFLQGDGTAYYNQTFSSAYGSAEVNGGLLAAMSALTLANFGNPLTFIGPTLESSVESFQGSSEVTQLSDPLITATVGYFITTGPGSLLITSGPGQPYTGTPMQCEGLADSVPNEPGYSGQTELTQGPYPYGCTGGIVYTVPGGEVNFHSNANYQYQYTRQIQVTDTYRIFDTYTLIGVPGDVSVPEPGTTTLLASGLLALLLSRRFRYVGKTTA